MLGSQNRAGFNELNESCWRSPAGHTTRPMWTQNLMMTDQAAWLELPVLEPGFPGLWSRESFLPRLLAAAGRLADYQANAAGAPLPSSILAAPSSSFTFPLPACDKSGHGCARPAGLDPYHVPQHVPMWTALLEENSAQCPGQGSPRAAQAAPAVECISSATTQVGVVATVLATRLAQSMVKAPQTLAHWMSSSVLGQQRLLTAWALEGLDTVAAGHMLAEGPLLAKPKPLMVPCTSYQEAGQMSGSQGRHLGHR